MKTGTLNIASLIQKVGSGEVRLPEIQRAYIWKPTQIASLVDSLYRTYPSGSLLLWETDATVSERDAAIEGPSGMPMNKPQYLLDGQQRLTSLHRLYTNHEKALVVFNVETEKFQIESAATRKDARWVAVHTVITGAEGVFALAPKLHERLPHLSPETIGERLERLRKISDYPYFIEILENLPYEQVAEIFVRVNSKGRKLRQVDLALATVSARWPGVIRKLDTEAEWLESQGYRHLNVSFLTRCLAALSTDTGTLAGFTSAAVSEIETGWEQTKAGLAHLIPLLKQNAGVGTSDLLPSINALVPLVVYLGVRPDAPLPAEDANALVYWLFGAFLLSRFSGPSETVIAQDAKAAKSDNPIEKLYGNLGLLNERLTVTEEALLGKGANSPYFLFSFLAAREEEARDWYFGVDIAAELEGSLKLEYHHIHPRATLKKLYAKAQINDLANYAFISAKANRKIRDRQPAKYFPEVGDEDLARHFVPSGGDLREPEAYPEFLKARRRLLAEGMTALLETFRPESLTTSTGGIEDPAAGESLDISIFARSVDDPDGVVVLTARSDSRTWTSSVPFAGWSRFFSDVQEGDGSDLEIGGERISVSTGAEEIDMPLGPLVVRGSLEEWNKVLERELDDLQDVDLVPAVVDPEPWTTSRQPLSVLASE